MGDRMGGVIGQVALVGRRPPTQAQPDGKGDPSLGQDSRSSELQVMGQVAMRRGGEDVMVDHGNLFVCQQTGQFPCIPPARDDKPKISF